MPNLTSFLLARIAEDEELAQGLRLSWQTWVLAECEAKRRIVELHQETSYLDGPPCCAICTQWDDYPWRVTVGHDPWPCATLKALAQPYADHPDFDPSWRV